MLIEAAQTAADVSIFHLIKIVCFLWNKMELA